uniref:Protein unc-45 homolog A n=1 Tax=Geotrypetes seraphini TaxID=260995 RepID=A0A6P8NZQ8_GEOSA|nr:protein unc-45 homolog A [Geotrypetes seraphini]
MATLEDTTGYLREEGNTFFKSGDYKAAVACYTKAINFSKDRMDRAVLYRNRAACYLKLEDYSKAEADATQAVEVDGGDVKALFRRGQALEKLGQLEKASTDLQRCLSLEPKNKVFQEAVRNLGVQIQEKVRLMSTTDSRVEQMFQILLNPEEKDTEKQQKAAQNLIVLARDDAGAEKIFQNDGVHLLLCLLDTGKTDTILAALRTLAGLCSGHQSRVSVHTNTVHWLEILQALLLSQNVEVQYRGAVIVMNMVAADQEVAAKLMESEMLEILCVLSKDDVDEKKRPVTDAAKECLAKAVEYGLIQANVNDK